MILLHHHVLGEGDNQGERINPAISESFGNEVHDARRAVMDEGQGMCFSHLHTCFLTHSVSADEEGLRVRNHVIHAAQKNVSLRPKGLEELYYRIDVEFGSGMRRSRRRSRMMSFRPFRVA